MPNQLVSLQENNMRNNCNFFVTKYNNNNNNDDNDNDDNKDLFIASPTVT